MEPGTRLGPYAIVEPLGAGGMGEVWLAEDSRLGRKVAIKVLPIEFAADAERLARFEQEARASAALNHPHIAAVHDVGELDGTHYMVQEYLIGQTLRDLLSEGPLPLRKAMTIATEIVEALAAAHQAGIVHRDLKPENVFVTEGGHAKVLDFGLAKLAIEAAGDGTISGTPTRLCGPVLTSGRPARRQRRLHVARAGRGTRSRSPQRPVRIRLHPVRAGDGIALLRRTKRARRREANGPTSAAWSRSIGTE